MTYYFMGEYIRYMYMNKDIVNFHSFYIFVFLNSQPGYELFISIIWFFFICIILTEYPKDAPALMEKKSLLATIYKNFSDFI